MTRIQEMGYERPTFQGLSMSFFGWVSYLSTGLAVLGGIHDASSTMWATRRNISNAEIERFLVHGIDFEVERESSFEATSPMDWREQSCC